MKILLLTKRYYTNKDLLEDQFGRLFELPKHWVRAGVEVTVVAFDYKRNDYEKSCIDGVNFINVPAHRWWLPRIKKEILPTEFNVVISSGNTNIASYGQRFSEEMGIPHIIDLYDYYPAFLGVFHPFGAIKLSGLLRKADGVVGVSSALCNWAKSYNNGVCHIPNGVDLEDFESVNQKLVQKQFALDSGFRWIGVFGSLKTSLGLKEVHEAIKKFLIEKPDCRFLIAGEGGEKLSKFENVRHLGTLDQRTLFACYQFCDCLLVPYRSSLQVKYSHSARLFEYIASRKPIVVSRVGAATDWIDKSFIGWFEPSSESSLNAAIERQLDKAEILPWKNSYSWKYLADQYLKALRILY